jgi:hypothetical protein
VDTKQRLGFFDQWSLFLHHFAEEIASRLGTYNLFPKNAIALFREVIKANKTVLDEIKTPYFALTDLWQGNVLLSKRNTILSKARIDLPTASEVFQCLFYLNRI